MRRQLGKLYSRQASLNKKSQSNSATIVTRKSQLEKQIKSLEGELEKLKCQRIDIPEKIKVSQLDQKDKLDALPNSGKLLLNLIRMIAYRAESRMMSAIEKVQGKKKRPRSPLAELFQSEADIVPEPENGILRIRILGAGERID